MGGMWGAQVPRESVRKAGGMAAFEGANVWRRRYARNIAWCRSTPLCPPSSRQFLSFLSGKYSHLDGRILLASHVKDVGSGTSFLLIYHLHWILDVVYSWDGWMIIHLSGGHFSFLLEFLPTFFLWWLPVGHLKNQLMLDSLINSDFWCSFETGKHFRVFENLQLPSNSPFISAVVLPQPLVLMETTQLRKQEICWYTSNLELNHIKRYSPLFTHSYPHSNWTMIHTLTYAYVYRWVDINDVYI